MGDDDDGVGGLERDEVREPGPVLRGRWPEIPPSALAALYVSLRVGLANLSPVSDCDEVYNYWEPVHFLHYGTGMQTWEYAPMFALRTYAYLVPMALLSRFYELLLRHLPSPAARGLGRALSPGLGGAVAAAASSSSSSSAPAPPYPDKPLQFRLLRSTLSVLTALSELTYHRSISRTLSPPTANWTLLALSTSAGMFQAAPAYLPSSHAMSLWMFSASCQMRGDDRSAVLLGIAAVLALGWPFSGALFVSTGLRAVLRAAYGDGNSGDGDGADDDEGEDARGRGRGRGWADPDLGSVLRLLLRTALHAAFVQGAVTAVDYVHYGRILSPTINIFLYNAAGGGDELYGVEPASYYVKNLLLNLNVVAALGALAPPALLLGRILGRRSGGRGSLGVKAWTLAPVYVWLAIVVPRPHKEERFLFPVYPALCLGAVLVVEGAADVLADVMGGRLRARGSDGAAAEGAAEEGGGGRRDRDRDRARARAALCALVFLPAALVSISRSAALFVNYSAPLGLYDDLYRRISRRGRVRAATEDEEEEPLLVCVGGEWHRFPSSYHLPPDARLGFLRSSFSGQLPRPFTRHGSRVESEAARGGAFNDRNREEEGRYAAIEDCSYVVELVDGGGGEGRGPAEAEEGRGRSDAPECVRYMDRDPGEWEEVSGRDFLDAERTAPAHRVLYLPWIRGGKVVNKRYSLFERKA